MKYKVIEIMGNFETLIGKEISASDYEEVKEIIVNEIKNNFDKYLYPVIEVVENEI